MGCRCNIVKRYGAKNIWHIPVNPLCPDHRDLLTKDAADSVLFKRISTLEQLSEVRNVAIVGHLKEIADRLTALEAAVGTPQA